MHRIDTGRPGPQAEGCAGQQQYVLRGQGKGQAQAWERFSPAPAASAGGGAGWLHSPLLAWHTGLYLGTSAAAAAATAAAAPLGSCWCRAGGTPLGAAALPRSTSKSVAPARGRQ